MAYGPADFWKHPRREKDIHPGQLTSAAEEHDVEESKVRSDDISFWIILAIRGAVDRVVQAILEVSICASLS